MLKSEVIQRARIAGIDAGLDLGAQSMEDQHRRIPYCALDTAMRTLLDHLIEEDWDCDDDTDATAYMKSLREALDHA